MSLYFVSKHEEIKMFRLSRSFLPNKINAVTVVVQTFKKIFFVSLSPHFVFLLFYTLRTLRTFVYKNNYRSFSPLLLFSFAKWVACLAEKSKRTWNRMLEVPKPNNRWRKNQSINFFSFQNTFKVQNVVRKFSHSEQIKTIDEEKVNFCKQDLNLNDEYGNLFY